MAALKWSEGRKRFRELGMGPECFANGDLAVIARALLAETPFTRAELHILDYDDGSTLPIRLAIAWTGSPEAALHWVDRLAQARLRYWAPRWMAWAWSGMRAGWPLPRIAAELRAIADQLEGVAA